LEERKVFEKGVESLRKSFRSNLFVAGLLKYRVLKISHLSHKYFVFKDLLKNKLFAGLVEKICVVKIESQVKPDFGPIPLESYSLEVEVLGFNLERNSFLY
jgi:hypothetical protein